ncbi:uncharacterized protein J7T54_000628 [Emericellopsis cladophorae]|uniref:MARVEL domain-containing protein n=1 Tax=Emericellopsis cladophorae TaxID=2686198 RepID=A0A9Q0BFP4_9HYPO|nr:uncharacterized protein J7T54_000628 [Emericellopsis cladophorae]KAI6783126.1 hypothetical protein J7T54_000628 [Emericellopsis cladophorae]
MTGATAWFIVSFRGSKRDFAIIGISAISLAYSFVAMLLTCCLAGISFLSLIGAIIDLFLFAAMIAVAVLNRDGRFGCPSGAGTTCRLYVATFALAIISLVAYLINAGVSYMIRRAVKEIIAAMQAKSPVRSTSKPQFDVQHQAIHANNASKPKKPSPRSREGVLGNSTVLCPSAGRVAFAKTTPPCEAPDSRRRIIRILPVQRLGVSCRASSNLRPGFLLTAISVVRLPTAPPLLYHRDNFFTSVSTSIPSPPTVLSV